MSAGFLTKLNIFLKSIKLFKNWYVYPLVYFKLTKKDHVIFQTKTGLKRLYSDPKNTIDLPKVQKWAAVQIVKAFLGIPIVPGK